MESHHRQHLYFYQQPEQQTSFSLLWLHDSNLVVHNIFFLCSEDKTPAMWSQRSFNENVFHLRSVYIQSVALREKLDFYGCGFVLFPSAAVELRLEACGAAALASFSRAAFIGGSLDCPGTLTGRKLTPWLGRVVCSTPDLSETVTAQDSWCLFQSAFSSRWVGFDTSRQMLLNEACMLFGDIITSWGCFAPKYTQKMQS